MIACIKYALTLCVLLHVKVNLVSFGGYWMRLQRLENYRHRDIGFTVIMHYPDQTRVSRDK
jgi:hypothetical protein